MIVCRYDCNFFGYFLVLFCFCVLWVSGWVCLGIMFVCVWVSECLCVWKGGVRDMIVFLSDCFCRLFSLFMVFVCFLVCISICVYVFAFLCVWVCMYVCIYVCLFVCIYVCMYVSVFLCVCVCVSLSVCVFCMYLILIKSVSE